MKTFRVVKPDQFLQANKLLDAVFRETDNNLPLLNTAYGTNNPKLMQDIVRAVAKKLPVRLDGCVISGVCQLIEFGLNHQTKGAGHPYLELGMFCEFLTRLVRGEAKQLEALPLPMLPSWLHWL